jgi:phthiodiolone/phenolphthiodiolone dimycocerosates ketoreductase
MVSFWPDSIWTPEFTDLALSSKSPHRHLDGLAVAAAAAVMTEKVSIGTMVVDTVRRHPSMLAQTALTIDHLAKGRFILGLGAGELENCAPYGFEFVKPVSRFEEALRVIKLLWQSDGPVDFEGQFFHLKHARMDTEPYEGRFPRIFIGAIGPRMLEIAGRYGDGWYCGGSYTPEQFVARHRIVRESAEKADRDPDAIVTAFMTAGLIGDEDEIAEMVKAPLVKAYMLQLSAADLAVFGHEHPLGPNWRGFQDLDPRMMTRDKVLDLISKVDPEALLAILPHGTPRQLAAYAKGFVDAGVQVAKILDYGGMAGRKFAAKSPLKVREAEAELLRMCA